MGLFRGIGSRKDATRGTSPIEVRKVLAGLFASVGGIGARSGIIYNGTPFVMAGDATWAYSVPIFHAFVSRSASDGGTVYGNDGAVLIGATGVGSTIPIAPGAGLQRIDVAWTRHPTAGENGDSATTVALASEPLFGVASGAAVSSGPVAPSIPAGAFEIGRNLMTSAATSTLSAGNTITQSALYTAVRGAPVPVRNATERNALPLFDGQRVYRLDLHCVERYDGTIWHSGAVPLVFTDAGIATSGTINVFTTALRTVTDPFGAGVPYRCKVTYHLGIVTAAAGVNARAWVNVNGAGITWGLVSPLSSATPSTVADMPAGGTVTFQSLITNLTATMATVLDAGSHFMTTEVSPL